jgi:hypothetical protein
MNTQQTPATERRNPGGRPALAEGQASERINVRLTPAQRVAFEAAGGAEWLRRQLDALLRIGAGDQAT